VFALFAAADVDSNHTIEKNEFKGLITYMASADLWSRQLAETVRWKQVVALHPDFGWQHAATRAEPNPHSMAPQAARSSSESESEEQSEEEVVQDEILQSIAQESFEEVVTKQKAVQK